MANMSDMIENFILQAIRGDSLDISRNELADYFNVSPSQINYVLSTRFTYARGYLIESHRGGGGYVRIVKIEPTSDEYLLKLLKDDLASKVDYNHALQIVENLKSRGIIDEVTSGVIRSAISPNSLKMPISYEDEMRAKILANIIKNIL